MSRRADRRAALAAAALLAVLAGTYEAAWQFAAALAARRAAVREALARAAATDTKVAAAAAEVVRAEAARERARHFSPADTVSGCVAGPLRFGAVSAAARRPRVLRRYVGTVGGQPATALLSWSHPDSILGSFYLRPRGPEYSVSYFARKAGVTVLEVFQDSPVNDFVGQWRLRGRPGAVLRGTWQPPTGPPQTLLLRESYAGALRLSLETTYLTGGWTNAWEPGYHDCPHVPVVSHEFFHLAAPGSVPAGLRPWLSPGEAARRRATRRWRDGGCRVAVGLTVRLHDFGLLSYETTTSTDPYQGHSGSETVGSPLLDLLTGRAWPTEQLLQPGYWPRLRRLVAHHLRHDPGFRQEGWEWQHPPRPAAPPDTADSNISWDHPDLAPRPESWVCTVAGLELTYSYDALSCDNAHGWATVLLPYAELRPLLRPGTPLRRLLRARGL